MWKAIRGCSRSLMLGVCQGVSGWRLKWELSGLRGLFERETVGESPSGQFVLV